MEGIGGQFSIARSLSFASFALNNLMNPLFFRATTFEGMVPLTFGCRDVSPEGSPCRSNSIVEPDIIARALAPLALVDLIRDLVVLVKLGTSASLFCPCGSAWLEGDPVTPFALRERSLACACASSSEISLIEGDDGFSFHPGNPFTDKPCSLTSFRVDM